MEFGQLNPRVTILCDFDGTISPSDISNFLFSRFAGCGLYYEEQWHKGLIGTREQLELTFATIQAGPVEIAEKLKEIPIDPTFHELLAFARQHEIGLAVVSDGMDWPIEVVLARHGIGGLPIYSNHVSFEGERPVCTFPWYDPSTPMAGTCKPLIVQRYRQQGSRIVFVGDGRSDREAARGADLVFAKGELADYCHLQGIRALQFNTFTEVCAQLVPWLREIKKERTPGAEPPAL
ncbi:MAG TPA: MtnX-like HAD-IB family phosphatase [Anaerolineales bacterium]|nr:MtnX-like HAD-IB family phosphatase [Anaerolineales bacterium]